jgi:hypothetical protein
MGERLAELKTKFSEFWDTIKESESYQQLKGKYDELDARTQIIIQLSIVGGFAFMILMSVLAGMAKVGGLKGDIDTREKLIGYLQQSSDTIKQYKMQAQAEAASLDSGGPLNQLALGVLGPSNIDGSRVEISNERDGAEDKQSKEVLVDVKLSQVNLRQITKFMFNITEQGRKRNVTIRDLNIDTKDDPSGYMDAAVTIAAYKVK